MHEQDPETEPQPASAPRIYVASLSDYNDGILHGDWIGADDDPEVMQTAIDQMLDRSPTARRYGQPAEEWAIHDYEGFGSISIGEHTPLSEVAAYAEGINVHGQAFTAWVAYHGAIPEDHDFEDAYLGEWASAEEYAEHLLDDFGLEQLINEQVPEALRYYVKVDAAGFARDLELGGDIIVLDTPTGGVWIFAAN